MNWRTLDMLPVLLLAFAVSNISNAASESDMLTLEEYRSLIHHQQAPIRNNINSQKSSRPSKKFLSLVSEKSLFDDLGDSPLEVGRENGDSIFEGGRAKGTWGNSKLNPASKRHHRNGEVHDRSRYTRSVDEKETEVNTNDDANDDGYDKINDSIKQARSEGSHVGLSPANQRKYLPEPTDQIHVVSSAIRILPPPQKKDEASGRRRTARIMNVTEKDKRNLTTEDDSHRQKRNEYHWRRPKTQFVTGTYRMSPPSSRFQLPAFPPPQGRNNRRYLLDNEITSPYRRSSNGAQRRIIYYATLPEIVRRPSLDGWQHPTGTAHAHSTRQAATPSGQDANYNRPPAQYYPLAADNEVTRVTSAVIDVTNTRDQPSLPSQQPPATAILSSSAISSITPLQPPKYTIYDMEPPYTRPYYNTNGYNSYYNDNKLMGYDKQRYGYYNNYYQPQQQPYQPYGSNFPPPQQMYQHNNNNNRYYEDVRTPPYRVHHQQQQPVLLPPYPHPQPFYYRKPEYVPVEVTTTASTIVSSTQSTTTASTADANAVGDPRHQTSSTAETAANSNSNTEPNKGNSTNNLISRYI